MRADLAKGLVRSLTASTTKEVKRESGRICSVLGYFIPARILLLVAVLCSIVPHLCQHAMLYKCSVHISELQSWNWRLLAIWQFWSLTFWSSLCLIITNMWFLWLESGPRTKAKQMEKQGDAMSENHFFNPVQQPKQSSPHSHTAPSPPAASAVLLFPTSTFQHLIQISLFLSLCLLSANIQREKLFLMHVHFCFVGVF